MQPGSRFLPMRRLNTPRGAISAMFLINGIVWGTWIARIPTIAAHLDVSRGELGAVLPAFSIGALVSLPFAGWLTGKIGSANVFRWFGVARTAAFPMLAFASAIPVFAVILFCFGFSHGSLDVAANAQGVEIERRRRSPILSSVHGFFSLGGLLGAASAGVVAGLGVSLQLQFLSLGIVAILLYLVASRQLVPDTAVPLATAVPATGRRFRISLPPRSLWPLGAIAFVVALGDESIGDWGGLLLTQELGASAATAAMVYTVYSLTMLVGRMTGDRLVRRFGPVLVIAAGGAISAAGLVAGQLIFTVPSVLVGIAMVGFGLSSILPITYRAAATTPGVPGGKGVALVATIGYAGFLCGPPVIGRVSDVSSLQVALLLIGIVMLALVFLSRTVGRPEPSPDLRDGTLEPVPAAQSMA
ncbi:MAG: MFS transporter [Thermomicrobiales bacterium]